MSTGAEVSSPSMQQFRDDVKKACEALGLDPSEVSELHVFPTHAIATVAQKVDGKYTGATSQRLIMPKRGKR